MEGRFNTEGFLLPEWGAYTWGAYFQNLTVTSQNSLNVSGNILRKLTFKCHSGSSILVWH